MSKNPIHVIPHSNSTKHWAVKREGAKRASSLHTTKEEAVRAATVTAKRERTELEIHTQDGKIAERNSYGHDPRDRKTQESPSKPMTGRELYPMLLKNGLIGLWKDRSDIGDSSEYARVLRERAGRPRGQ